MDLWFGLWDCTGTNDYGPCIHADPAADSAVDVYATHDYGFKPLAPPSWLTKPVWETEVSGLGASPQAGPSVDIGNGLAVAGWIYSALVTGQASAWHYWWLVNPNNDNEGLLFPVGRGPGGVGDVNSPPKRLYALGNFSKFVRPGFVRIDVSGPVPGGVQTVAFQNPADGTTVVVAINGNQGPTPVSFFVSGSVLPAAMTPWVTSATANLAAATDVPLASARFTATLDPKSVTTFVGKP
jgi:glucuronoarabinoxylan endo-1,4-beta-xylanase